MVRNSDWEDRITLFVTRDMKRNRAEREEEAKRATETAADAQPGVFQRSALSAVAAAEAHRNFVSSQPYMHVQLQTTLQPNWLLSVQQELSQLQSTFKETDLFKVYQTGDLANIDAEDPAHAAALPHTLALRNAIYSARFRKFIQRVTGCAPLTEQTDCSCNVYKRGGHLLCHDDVIGTRCVSYIIYLSRPNKKWHPKYGGALELYPLAAEESGVPPQPEVVPSAVVPPDFGSMVLFTVQPGVSYHAVQEVFSSQPRLSVSGWFHAASPPEGAHTDASLAQLQGARPGAAALVPRPLRSIVGARLSPGRVRLLAAFINPVYLQEATIQAVRAQLEANGAAQLSGFLLPTLASAIAKAAAAADRRDALGGGAVPSYGAGLGRRGWRPVGPPQLQRYLRLRASTGKKGTAGQASGAAGGGPGTPAKDEGGAGEKGIAPKLRALRHLMHSTPFVLLLQALTGLTATRATSEVRRFRPGLDYTLAHVGSLREHEVTTSTRHTP